MTDGVDRKHVDGSWSANSVFGAIVEILDVHKVFVMWSQMYNQRYPGHSQWRVFCFRKHQVVMPDQTFVNPIQRKPGSPVVHVDMIAIFFPTQLFEYFLQLIFFRFPEHLTCVLGENFNILTVVLTTVLINADTSVYWGHICAGITTTTVLLSVCAYIPLTR